MLTFIVDSDSILLYLAISDVVVLYYDIVTRVEASSGLPFIQLMLETTVGRQPTGVSTPSQKLQISEIAR